MHANLPTRPILLLFHPIPKISLCQKVPKKQKKVRMEWEHGKSLKAITVFPSYVLDCTSMPLLSDVPDLETLGESELWDALTITHILTMTQSEFERFAHLFMPLPLEKLDKSAEHGSAEGASRPSTIVKVVNGVLVVDGTVINQPLLCREEVTTVRSCKLKDSRSWSKRDVALFYLGLRIFGEDFGRISSFVGPYNRKQVRNKYKKEFERNRPFVIFACDSPLSPSLSLAEFIESQQ